jgi:hypothetical protein
MRVPTQGKTRTNRHGRNPQPVPRAGLPQRPKRPSCRPCPDEAQPAEGETRQTPTLVLPAHAGLALARLDGILTRYSIDNEQAASATVALSFLEAGIVQESDDEPHASPNTLIKNAITRMLGDSLTFPDFDLVIRVVRFEEQERYYLQVFIDGMPVIPFDAAAEVFDVVDPQLGPSILGHVYRVLDLTPAFTPAVAKDLIEWQYWQGLDDDSALIEEAEQELEHQINHDGNAFTHEDVVAYAQEHYLTVAKVNKRLEPRYQEHGTLTLPECRALCETHGLVKALPVMGALEKLAELSLALPERDREVYDLIEGEVPFGLMLSLGGPGSLVHEVYDDYEQMILQSGMDYQPTYALAFDPNEPETIAALRDALVVCNLMLMETNVLVHALEAIS